MLYACAKWRITAINRAVRGYRLTGSLATPEAPFLPRCNKPPTLPPDPQAPSAKVNEFREKCKAAAERAKRQGRSAVKRSHTKARKAAEDAVE